MTNYSRSVLKSNGLHRSKNLPVKFGFSPIDTPANIAKKLPPQRCSKLLLIAFSASLTNGPRSLSCVKVGTHSAFGEKSHTAAHTPKQGRFGRGWYHYPRSVPHVHKHPRPGCQNGKLCRFWVLVGCAPEERREPAEQRCAYVRRCSEASRPRRAALLCLQFGDVAVFSLCVQYFLNVQGGRALSLPSACSACC